MPERPIFVLPPKRTFRNHLVFFITKKPLGALGAAVAILLVVTAVFARMRPLLPTSMPRPLPRISSELTVWAGTSIAG